MALEATRVVGVESVGLTVIEKPHMDREWAVWRQTEPDTALSG
jgi:hypothetical protein